MRHVLKVKQHICIKNCKCLSRGEERGGRHSQSAFWGPDQLHAFAISVVNPASSILIFLTAADHGASDVHTDNFLKSNREDVN